MYYVFVSVLSDFCSNFVMLIKLLFWWQRILFSVNASIWFEICTDLLILMQCVWVHISYYLRVNGCSKAGSARRNHQASWDVMVQWSASIMRRDGAVKCQHQETWWCSEVPASGDVMVQWSASIRRRDGAVPASGDVMVQWSASIMRRDGAVKQKLLVMSVKTHWYSAVSVSIQTRRKTKAVSDETRWN